MGKETRKRETFGSVIKKQIWFVLFFIALFAVAVLYKNNALAANSGKEVFLTPRPGTRPSLVPVAFAEPGESEETGVQGTVLEKSDPVGAEYFADAVFIGDSLTEGWKIYKVGQHFEVISAIGFSAGAAKTAAVYIAPDGRELIVADAIQYLGARKAYLMFGSNGLNWGSADALIPGYSELIDQIRLTNPDTYIIIQSIPPVTKEALEAGGTYRNYTLENVGYYNGMLRDLAMEKGVYFLDTYSALSGDGGHLPPEFSSGDGMHMNTAGYTAWLEYLQMHTIRGNADFAMDSEGRIIPMQPAAGEETGEPGEEPPAGE